MIDYSTTVSMVLDVRMRSTFDTQNYLQEERKTSLWLINIILHLKNSNVFNVQYISQIFFRELLHIYLVIMYKMDK